MATDRLLQKALDDERLDEFFNVLEQAPDTGGIRDTLAGIKRPDIQQLLSTARTSDIGQSPLRRTLEEQTLGYLSGTTPITEIPSYAASRGTLEQQIQNAREKITGGTAKGGGLSATLGQLELGRATGLAGLESQLFQQMFGTGTELSKLRSQETSSLFNTLAGLESSRFGTEFGGALGLGELESDIFRTKVGGAGQLAGSLADIYRSIGEGSGFGEAVQGAPITNSFLGGSGGGGFNLESTIDIFS